MIIIITTILVHQGRNQSNFSKAAIVFGDGRKGDPPVGIMRGANNCESHLTTVCISYRSGPEQRVSSRYTQCRDFAVWEFVHKGIFGFLVLPGFLDCISVLCLGVPIRKGF